MGYEVKRQPEAFNKRKDANRLEDLALGGIRIRVEFRIRVAYGQLAKKEFANNAIEQKKERDESTTYSLGIFGVIRLAIITSEGAVMSVFKKILSKGGKNFLKMYASSTNTQQTDPVELRKVKINEQNIDGVSLLAKIYWCEMGGDTRTEIKIYENGIP